MFQRYKKYAWQGFAAIGHSLSARITNYNQELCESTTIGICTYVRRFETYFSKVLPHIVSTFPECKIVVVANGYHDRAIQVEYLKAIRAFLRAYPTVSLYEHMSPMGLAYIWNQLVSETKTRQSFILNDDIDVIRPFRKDLAKFARSNIGVTLVNGSWSHFIISKSLWNRVGGFDAEFPGVGHEDQDFEIRMAMMDSEPRIVKSFWIRNLHEPTKDFSYGKQIEVAFKKYSASNSRHFDEKYDLYETWRPGAVFVRIMGKYCSRRIKTGTRDALSVTQDRR